MTLESLRSAASSVPRRSTLVVVLLVAGLVGLVLAGRAFDGVPSVADVRSLVNGAGPAGPAVYVLVYAAATLALAPGGALTVLAGVLFGPVLGTGVALAGAYAGAIGAFAVARLLGRARTRRLFGHRLQRADAWVADRGFLAILTLRMVPVVPFNVLNYAAGLTGVSPRAYVGATVLGIVPGTFAYAAVGGTAGDPMSLPFLAAVALVVGLVAVGWVLRRRVPWLQAGSPPAASRDPDGADGHATQASRGRPLPSPRR